MKSDSGVFAASTRRPTHEEIAAAAYHLYLEKGCQNGNDLDDWLRAEQLLTQKLQPQTAQKEAPVSPKLRTTSARADIPAATPFATRKTPVRSNRISGKRLAL
jgi:hypothetical protein